MNLIRNSRATMLLLCVLALNISNANAQDVIEDEGDAMDYATDNGVSLDEAQSRLDIQAEIGELDNILLLDSRVDYAGMYIDHQPVYKIYVQFKNQHGPGNNHNAGIIQRRLAKTSWRSLVKIRKTDKSLEELQTVQEATAAIVNQLSIPADLGINVAENQAELFVLNSNEFQAALGVSGLELPNGVE